MTETLQLALPEQAQEDEVATQDSEEFFEIENDDETGLNRLFFDPDEVFHRKIGMTYDELQKLIQDFNLAECPKCENIIEVVIGDIDRNFRDEDGKKLSEEALAHFAEHRVRCNRCSENFCKTCSSLPYHIGMTCKEFKAPKCRFCHVAIPEEDE